MTKKKSNKKTNTFTFNGYANIGIPDSMSNLVEQHIKDAQAIFEEVNTLAVDGYSIKIYHDSEQGNFRASLTCMNAEDDNYGFVLSAYAADWFTALAVLTFKHFDVAKENWQDYTQKSTGGWG